MHTALAQATAIYRREWCARPFTEDLAAHLRGGYVHSTPELMLWFRGVDASAPAEALLDPTHTWPRERWTGWLIWLLATPGPCDFAAVRALIPFPLPAVLYQRRNRLIRRTWQEMPFAP
jgi:hypothetical protein